MSRADLGPVELLADRHGIEGFDCGVTALDRWLRNSARTAAAAGTAATYVLCRGHRVVGYYALAMGSVGAEFGARAVIVDAIDDDAAAFYRHFGFRELAPHRMWRRVADIAAALEP